MQGMQKEHFLVAGGDMRLIGTANALFEKGYDTAVYLVQESPFLNPGIPILDAPCFSDFDRIILPLPCSRDDVHLSCAYDNKPVLSDVFSALNDKQKVYGGKLSPYVLSLAKQANVPVYDYLKDESFSIKNAILTAEGALTVAMQNTLRSIWGSSVLVVGYGRIAKVLANMLADLNAHVTVAARRKEALSWIEANGFVPCRMEDADEEIAKADIVFNTAPARLLNLRRMKNHAVYIELASKPYGAGFGWLDKESGKLYNM